MTGRIPPWARAQLLPWVRLPSAWIEARGLQEFRWAQQEGANSTAALMILTVIAHHANRLTGRAHLTWDELCGKADISRAKVSAALDILTHLNLIEREPEGRSTFQLTHFGEKDVWAMLPARGLYSGESVTAFRDFTLRLRAELDALKIYFLLAARRDRGLNITMLTYEKIELYSGVGRSFIRPALSLLASQNLVHTYNHPSMVDPHGVANAYRLTHLEPRRHIGTSGRGIDLLEG